MDTRRGVEILRYSLKKLQKGEELVYQRAGAKRQLKAVAARRKDVKRVALTEINIRSNI